MQSNPSWSQWAEILRRYKLDGFTAWLLEAGAPLTVIGAQMIHLTGPFLGGNQSIALAHMLEEEEQTEGFARYLRDVRGS